MDRQTLRDWVDRYNADPIAGLSDTPRSGRPPALAQAQMSALNALVVAGPDRELWPNLGDGGLRKAAYRGG